MIPVMISVKEAERAVIRANTLDQLRILNINPVVFTNNLPIGQGNHHANVIAALTYALEQGAIHVLFLEDDLLIAPWFPYAISEAIDANKDICSFYCAGVRFYPQPIRRFVQNGVLFDAGVFPIRSRKAWFGTQALLLTCSVAQQLVEREAHWQYLDDELARAREWGLYVYAPNPVQHLRVRSTSHWQKHSSRSFTFYEPF